MCIRDRRKDDGTKEKSPTVVIEVIQHNRDRSIATMVHEFFTPPCQVRILIIVRVFEPSGTDDSKTPLMCWVYRRAAAVPPELANLTQEISFGTAPLHHAAAATYPNRTGVDAALGAVACNAAGIAAFQIHLPAAEVYHGSVASPPGGVAVHPGFIIDLYDLQQDILARPSNKNQ